MIKSFTATLVILLTITNGMKAQKLNFSPLFTGIVVENIDTSISWYSKVLGLKVRNRVDNDSRGFKQAVLIDTGVMIELVELSRSVSQDSLLKFQQAGTRIRGFNKFGFAVNNIDSLFLCFSKMSIRFHGKMVTDAVNNKKTFLVMDPDGNLIQFFEK